ncbi:S8 family serine peptidase [Mycoplasmopsis agassizii]|uniref:S8 family serine peptidase n=1 Tax=Mycoplasmopsis agassizii TaxID=33922 RepID=UPI003529B1E2
MKKIKQLKTILTLLTGGIFIASSFAGISATSQQTPSIVNDSENSEPQLLTNKIKNATSISELIKGTFLTYYSIKKPDINTAKGKEKALINGANRLEIVFKASASKEKLNEYVNDLENIIKNKFHYVYGEHTLTLSISFNDLEDFKSLFMIVTNFNMDINDILQIDVFETNLTVENWKLVNNSIALDMDFFDPMPWCCRSYEDMHPPAKKTEPEKVYTPAPPPKPVYKRWDDEDNYWRNYTEWNRERLQQIGFTEKILTEERAKARKSWFNGWKAHVGILEARGTIKKDASIYTSDDMFIDQGSVDLHANRVAEIIIGKQGINPYARLYSVWTGWAGIRKGIENLVKKGVQIINNSWLFVDGTEEIEEIEYNENANWLDNFINANPEIVFIKIAGNDGNRGDYYYNKKNEKKRYKTPSNIAKYIDSYSLSTNSIIVGALNETREIKARNLTEFSNNANYISLSTPDKFESEYAKLYLTENEKAKGEGIFAIGTSLSAPTIAAIASLLKVNYTKYFSMGKDSIIMKSALLSGSRNYGSYHLKRSIWEKNTNTYDQRIGFGRPDFSKIKESIEKLQYFKFSKNNNKTNPIVKNIKLTEGHSYRMNFTWMNKDYAEKVWTGSDLTTGHWEWKHYGPINVKLDIVSPTDDKVNAYTDWHGSSLSSRANTVTFEFKPRESGIYKLNFYQDDKERKEIFDVAFTYSEI